MNEETELRVNRLSGRPRCNLKSMMINLESPRMIFLLIFMTTQTRFKSTVLYPYDEILRQVMMSNKFP